MSQDGKVFNKFHVHRTDGRDHPGGDRENAKYFVLDVTHDPFARRALIAYTNECEETHPQLSADIRLQYGLPKRI